MKQKMVVTNLRIPQENWLQVKAEAAQYGISVNDYIQRLIDEKSRKTFFAYKEKGVKRQAKKRRLYQPLWDIIDKPYNRKPMGASEDDKIIYGIED